MLVLHRVTPCIKFSGTQLYTWVERGIVRVRCLTQEHKTMSPARARTQTARSGGERTNHEATAPPILPSTNHYRYLTYVRTPHKLRCSFEPGSQKTSCQLQHHISQVFYNPHNLQCCQRYILTRQRKCEISFYYLHVKLINFTFGKDTSLYRTR